MNRYIYVAPIRQESSEVLAAKEMTFESLANVTAPKLTVRRPDEVQ